MIKKFLNWFHPKEKTEQAPSATIVNMAKMLAMTNETELACDDVHLLVDQFAEMKMRGDDVESLMPMMKHHLDLCRECLEEYDALVAALEFEQTL